MSADSPSGTLPGAAQGGRPRPSRELLRARYAIAGVFTVHGAVTGTFVARVPWVQDHAGVSAGQLGFALAFPAIGAALAMPMAARLSHRFGVKPTLRVMLALWTLVLLLPGWAPNVWALCAALFLYGATAGTSDVGMNALSVETENRMGRSIMSGLHGMWSVGVLIGSGVGTICAHADIDARVQFSVAAVVLTVIGLVVTQWVLDVRPEPGQEEEEAPPHFALPPKSALLIGGIAFCAVFAEGASLDWSAVYLEDVLDSSAAVAAASTTGFALTMAIARLLGDRLVDRFGAVPAVRSGGILATLGGLLVVLAPHPAMAMAGFALIGLGVAVVVPLAFAAAGRSGPNPSQAIAGVATVTYTSGLIAPSLIGGIADATSLVGSFILVTALASGLIFGAGLLNPNRTGTVRVASGAVPEPRPKSAVE
ncbi:MFS transporter [Yinghuangia sp. KLBMP8922]|uniref:MFS transporter n=2 Tax=Yinghuangia soli TaxID=2908204 RepID=A0AA41U0R1_9ACTN|nr:MFS transporter [Yinghuangia soli]MCF2530068.1 MFS transporter [Yinghuangia soli]